MSTSQTLPAWKEEVAAKLTEHRSRRKVPPQLQARLAELEPSFAANSRQPTSSNIAARVAERYSKAPSYREMIENQAANAPARLIQPTERENSAGAPAPKRRAALLDPEPDLFQASTAPTPASAQPDLPEPRARITRWAGFEPSPVPEFFSGVPKPPAAPDSFTRGAAEQAPEPFPEPAASLFAEPETSSAEPLEQSEEDPTRDLLEELASQPLEPALPLPARIIEFPRELVATRKARPRRERANTSDDDESHPQLRIFEAEPATTAAEPEHDATTASEIEVAPLTPAIEWNAIRLDEDPNTTPFFDAPDLDPGQDSLLLDPPLYTANLEDRLMAGIVDLCLVGVGFLMFVAAFVACTPHLLSGRAALVGAAGALLALLLIYQYLFLTFAQGTPGMRYAKIALCTFDDDNPTRQAVRARVGAVLLSALPLGLGFLWAVFDEDRLGWHDRITRTYQRSYRED